MNPTPGIRRLPVAVLLAGTAALACGLVALTACGDEGLLLRLPNGSEITVTVKTPPEVEEVEEHAAKPPDPAVVPPRWIFAPKFTIAHDGMRRAAPGSPEYRAWENFLAAAEMQLGQALRIQEVGYTCYLVEQVEEYVSHLPPEERHFSGSFYYAFDHYMVDGPWSCPPRELDPGLAWRDLARALTPEADAAR